MLQAPHIVNESIVHKVPGFGQLALVFLLVMGSGAAFSRVASPEKKDAQPKPLLDYHHSFKGDSQVPTDFRYDGVDAPEYVHFTPAGLQLCFPTGHEGRRQGTGVATTFGVQGDFEITMAFEILDEPTAAEAGHGTGVYLWAELDTPVISRGILTRAMFTKSWIPARKHFTTWVHLANPEAGKPAREEQKVFPARARTGRLRLVRKGSLLSCLVAEDTSEAFTLLHAHPFGTEDLKSVHVGGHTGGPKAALKANILDLRIQAGTLPGLPEDTQAEIPPRTREGAWIAMCLGLGLVTTLFLVGGVWFYMRRSRREAMAAPAPLANQQTRADEVLPSLSFACPQCAKSLKIRAELRGKKVKCPGCGASVRIPDSTMDSPEVGSS